MVFELAVGESLLLLQPDLDDLKGCHNQQRLSDTGSKASSHTPPITQVPVVVTQHALHQWQVAQHQGQKQQQGVRSQESGALSLLVCKSGGS